jgi:plasmid stabilization system protein ParE
MKIVWAAGAEDSFLEAMDYIAQDNIGAAAATAARILEAVEAIARFPMMGHASSQSGKREFAVPGTPFVVFYAVDKDVIQIAQIFHGKRQQPYLL